MIQNMKMTGRQITARLRGRRSLAVVFLLIIALQLMCFGQGESTSLVGGGKVEAHKHHAPHDGALVAFGDEFAHLEFVLDVTSGTLACYALDGEAENPVRLSQSAIRLAVKTSDVVGASSGSVELKATANVLTGETIGNTSEFNGQSDVLKGVKHFSAIIEKVQIKGSVFQKVSFKYPEGNE